MIYELNWEKRQRENKSHVAHKCMQAENVWKVKEAALTRTHTHAEDNISIIARDYNNSSNKQPNPMRQDNVSDLQQRKIPIKNVCTRAHVLQM